MTTDYLMLNSVFLTADREGPSDEILRDAHRAVKRLSKETQPQGAGHADAGRAGLALLKGNTAEAAAMLERADRTFSNLGMEAYSMSARLHRGRVIGGDRGQALVAEAEAWLREHGAASPHEYAQLVLNVPVVRRSS
jgi:GNAT superfamily N-acetyltransferase